jgi:DivIVA domain-containing protein
LNDFHAKEKRMTEATPGSAERAGITGDDLRSVKFGRAFGRGYEQGEVDSFLERCAGWMDWFNEQLKAAERRNADLQGQVATSTKGAEVQQAISILTGAQQAADSTVRQADNYSTTVMAEAKEFYEETRRRAVALEEETTARAQALERETQAKADSVWKTASARAAAVERESERNAKALVEGAQRRAEKLEQESRARLQELSIQAAAEQKELDAQTAYLSTLRETTRIQMQKFLEGMLDHVLDEYGRAHPLAAEAATDPNRPPVEAPGPGSIRYGSDRRRTRRPYGIAGQDARSVRQPVPPPRNQDQFEVLKMAETNGNELP